MEALAAAGWDFRALVGLVTEVDKDRNRVQMALNEMTSIGLTDPEARVRLYLAARIELARTTGTYLGVAISPGPWRDQVYEVSFDPASGQEPTVTVTAC